MPYLNEYEPKVRDRAVRVIENPAGLKGHAKKVGKVYTVRQVVRIQRLENEGLYFLGLPHGSLDDHYKLVTRKWEENTGVKPDFEEGTRIDIMYNDGTILCNVPADGHRRDEHSWMENVGGPDRGVWTYGIWDRAGGISNIRKYRIRVAKEDGSSCTDAVQKEKEPSPKEQELKVLL